MKKDKLKVLDTGMAIEFTYYLVHCIRENNTFRSILLVVLFSEDFSARSSKEAKDILHKYAVEHICHDQWVKALENSKLY